MKLYLVRHAEPKKEIEDPNRPLSEKGWIEIMKLAAFASEHSSIQVKRIIHSDKLRAQQTAELLAEHLNPPNGVFQEEGLKPLDDPVLWTDRLSITDEDTMLVGHLPFLSKLASLLLCHDADEVIVKFNTSGTVCLERDESGTWSIQWMLSPDFL